MIASSPATAVCVLFSAGVTSKCAHLTLWQLTKLKLSELFGTLGSHSN